MRKAYLNKQKTNACTFWDNLWRNYSLEEAVWEVETNFMKPIFAKYFPKEGKILEAGCGLGKYVIYYKKKGYDIEGVDLAAETINRLKKFDSSLPVRTEDLTKLSSSNEYYSVYYSGGAIEHFEEGPESVLGEARRVLKKDGCLIITVPYLNLMCKIKDLLSFSILRKPEKIKLVNGQEYLMYRLTKIYKKDIKESEKWIFHQYVYTKQEIEKILQRCGFKPIFSKPIQIKWSIRMIRSRRNIMGPNDIKQKDSSFLNLIGRHFLCEDGSNIMGNVLTRVIGLFFAHQIVFVCKKSDEL